MADKLIEMQVKFHLDKASQLEREYQTRKTAGEKRLLKSEHELELELSRIQDQIKAHRTKAEVLRTVSVSNPLPEQSCHNPAPLNG